MKLVKITLGTIFYLIGRHFIAKKWCRKNVKFRVTRHWLEVANQWLEVTRQFSWLDSDSTRPSHDSNSDSKKIWMTLTWLWHEGLVTLTRQKWLGHITAYSMALLAKKIRHAVGLHTNCTANCQTAGIVLEPHSVSARYLWFVTEKPALTFMAVWWTHSGKNTLLHSSSNSLYCSSLRLKNRLRSVIACLLSERWSKEWMTYALFDRLQSPLQNVQLLFFKKMWINYIWHWYALA